MIWPLWSQVTFRSKRLLGHFGPRWFFSSSKAVWPHWSQVEFYDFSNDWPLWSQAVFLDKKGLGHFGEKSFLILKRDLATLVPGTFCQQDSLNAVANLLLSHTIHNIPPKIWSNSAWPLWSLYLVAMEVEYSISCIQRLSLLSPGNGNGSECE